MKNEKQLRELQKAMTVVNLTVLLYYSIICTATTFRLCAARGAYDFLYQVSLLPERPWEMPLRSLALFAALCGFMWRKNHHNLKKLSHRLAFCFAEMLLCLGVIASCHFYYSGVALMVLADLVHYIQHSKYRMCFMAVMMLCFAFGKQEILSPYLPSIPFFNYLDYYDQSVRGFFSGGESLLVSVNILLFVLFMVLLFTGQKEENIRIRTLNAQLNYTNRQLNDAYAQLKENAAQIQQMTAVQERNRLAREIHDTLGHTLTGIIMSADACQVIMDVAPDEAKKRIGIIGDTAREGLKDVRRSIKALRPDALEQHDLEGALSKLVENFCITTNVAVEYRQEAGSLSFAPDEEDAVYRIVQETMTNAVRHGGADTITVLLKRTEQRLTIRVTDNGKGCEIPTEGFGLSHMKERLKMLHGTLCFENRSDGERGFEVTAELPLRGK